MTDFDAATVPRPRDIVVVAPPELPRSGGRLARWCACCRSSCRSSPWASWRRPSCRDRPLSRNPMFLAFPMMMLVSMVVTAVTGRHTRRGSWIAADRAEYLGYLGRLRQTVARNRCGATSITCRRPSRARSAVDVDRRPTDVEPTAGRPRILRCPGRARNPAARHPFGGPGDLFRRAVGSGHRRVAAAFPGCTLDDRGRAGHHRRCAESRPCGSTAITLGCEGCCAQ